MPGKSQLNRGNVVAISTPTPSDWTSPGDALDLASDPAKFLAWSPIDLQDKIYAFREQKKQVTYIARLPDSLIARLPDCRIVNLPDTF